MEFLALTQLVSQEMLKIIICKRGLENTLVKLLSHLPGAIELIITAAC